MKMTDQQVERTVASLEDIGRGIQRLGSAIYDTLGSEKVGAALDTVEGMRNVDVAIDDLTDAIKGLKS